MNLTDKHLLLEREHPTFPALGLQRIYRLDNGYDLSLVNPPILRSYPFAWEVAVLKNIGEDGSGYDLTYETEITNDVEVFDSDADTNHFIVQSLAILGNLKEGKNDSPPTD